ncbi:MAG: triose-phosphate isomerase [Patescibacteria group bacterium]|nr:triose-phosphate isomerase [Patescibacteria group bacterium]
MKIVIANWKMNPLKFSDAEKLINNYQIFKNVKVWITPPNIFLLSLKNKFKKIIFGAQNIHFEEKGAYTGEISAKMIKNIGARFVIINHSERRKMGENLEMANKKIISALEINLITVVCLGEEKRIKNLSQLKNEWSKQLNLLFKEVNLIKNKNRIIIAYEPTWAISTYGQGSVPREIVYYFINFLREKNIQSKIIYGGSVFKENIENYLDLPLDGFLIGSQSLIPKNFNRICSLITSSKKQSF